MEAVGKEVGELAGAETGSGETGFAVGVWVSVGEEAACVFVRVGIGSVAVGVAVAEDRGGDGDGVSGLGVSSGVAVRAGIGDAFRATGEGVAVGRDVAVGAAVGIKAMGWARVGVGAEPSKTNAAVARPPIKPNVSMTRTTNIVRRRLRPRAGRAGCTGAAATTRVAARFRAQRIAARAGWLVGSTSSSRARYFRLGRPPPAR